MIRRKITPRSGNFNWESLREKMEQFSSALTIKLDDTKLAAMLAERADQLANDVENEEFEQTIDVLIFELGNEEFAIDTGYVSEVIPLKTLTRVPGAPDFILGVVSRRGEIISVIDLNKFMFLPPSDSCTHLIFVEAFGFQVGLAIHRLKEIARLAKDSIQPLQTQLSGEQAVYLVGVTETGTALLHVEELLSSERLNMDQN
jgi:purine-binding chemotaxis protein CheW